MYFILLFVFLTIILSLYYKNWKNRIMPEYPYADSFPIIGNCFDVWDSKQLLPSFKENYKKFGKTHKYQLGPAIIPLSTCDRKLAEVFMNNSKSQTKGLPYCFLKSWLGEGLLTSGGAKWKLHRKILTPAFHFEILKNFVEIFETVGDVFIKKLTQNGDSISVDLKPFINLFTLDTILESAMGVKINAQNGENCEYVNALKEILRIATERCFSPFKLYICTYIFTADFYKERKMLKILHKFTYNVIYERIRERKSDSFQNIKKPTFLDILLNIAEESNELTIEEIREEVDTFTFEGHDTTSSVISFTLYSISNHPEVQNKILKEQEQLFGQVKDPVVTYQSLQEMKYLEMVIKEVLRLYPPVSFILRNVVGEIDYCGCKIPNNTPVHLSIYHLHRDETVFPNPEKFDPDRFLNFDKSVPYAYVPFSAGPRNCIGQKFAMLELKSIISKIIRHFELTPAYPDFTPILSLDFVLQPDNGMKVGLKKRC